MLRRRPLVRVAGETIAGACAPMENASQPKRFLNLRQTLEPRLRQVIGIAAILGPGLHLLSDILEWVSGGFSPPQLWVNYLGFVLIPFLMVGLYAVQRPQAGWGVLTGLCSMASPSCTSASRRCMP
jgi:hypothetical protein